MEGDEGRMSELVSPKAVTILGGRGHQPLACRGNLALPKRLAAEGDRRQTGVLCPASIISLLMFHGPQTCCGIEFRLESLTYVLLRGLGIMV